MSKAPPFPSPKIDLEQHVTPPELASAVLWNAYLSGHINGKIVADFGCGTGIFCRGAELLGAEECLCLELDYDALVTARGYLERAEALNADVTSSPLRIVDVVVMNPPFGTQRKGQDKEFLLEAFRLARIAVYSIHLSSSSTIRLCSKLAQQFGFTAEIVTVDYRMKREYAWHRKRFHEMPTDVYKFVRVIP